jgi:hypothetical protein
VQGIYPVTNFMEMEEVDFKNGDSKQDRRNVLGPAHCSLRDVAWNRAIPSQALFRATSLLRSNERGKDVALPIEKWYQNV